MNDLSYVNSQLLVDRERETAELSELVDRSFSAAPRPVIVYGSAGTGKTQLADWVARYAVAKGIRVLVATGAERERSVPFGIISQLIAGAGSPTSEAEEARSLLNDGIVSALNHDFGSENYERPFGRVLLGFSRFIDKMDRTARTLLIVDDAHHADQLSLACLLHLLRNRQVGPVMLLVTAYKELLPEDQVFFSELRRHLGCHVMTLTPLSRRGVARLLVDRLGCPVSEQTADEYYNATGGNALLVESLIGDQLAAGQKEGVLAGEQFRHAVISSVQRMGDDVLKVAKAIAVIGDPVISELYQRQFGLEPAQVARIMQGLQGAGILATETTFRHAAARDVIARHVQAEERKDLHYQMAAMLHARNAAPLEVAGHLLHAGPRTASWAVYALQEAAEEALLSSSEPDLAIRCLELARQCCTDARRRIGITVALARVVWQTSPAIAAKHVIPLVTARRNNDLSDVNAAELARSLLWYGRNDEAREILSSFLEEGKVIDAQSIIELKATYFWVRTTCPNLLNEVDWSAIVKDDRASAANLRLRVGELLETVLTAGDDDGSVSRHAEELLEQSLLGRTPDYFMGTSQGLLVLMYAGHLDLAMEWSEKLIAESAIRTSRTWYAKFLSVTAEVARRLGKLESAIEYATSAMEYLSVSDWGIGSGLPLSVIISAATALGDSQLATHSLSRPMLEAMYQSRYGLHYMHARGEYQLARGDFYAALDDFLSCGMLMSKWNMDRPTLLPWRSSASTTLEFLGAHDRTAQLSIHHLVLLGETGSPGTNDRNEEGRGHQVIGVSAARSWAPDAQRVVPFTPGGNGHGRRDGQRLSDAELRVASLAAKGLTNREIARKLFLTNSTVEQHLTRAYRKLRIRRREELPRYLADSAGTAG